MFLKKNIAQIPIEASSHAMGSRKVIVSKEDTTSKYFEAHTYGYLEPGEKWEMHSHINIIEICVVTKGGGIVRDEHGNVERIAVGDRLIFPSNTLHEIENDTEATAEFYFFRFKDK